MEESMLQRKINGKTLGGRGLDSLLPPDDPTTLPISKIQPNAEQPRKSFDEARLAELAESIRQHGIIEPIVVKKEGEIYRIVAGERRFRAAQMLGLTQVPVTIYKGDEAYQVSLIENLQREDLNPIEVAEAYEELMKRFGYKQDELAKKVGKSRSEVSNCIRLLTLCEKAKDMLRNGELSTGQIRPLLVFEHDEQELWLERITNENLTARQVEMCVASRKSGHKKTKKTEAAGIWREKAAEIASGIKAKVMVKPKKRGVSLTIDFSSVEDFEAFSAFLKHRK